jgi:hypothetical protein
MPELGTWPDHGVADRDAASRLPVREQPEMAPRMRALVAHVRLGPWLCNNVTAYCSDRMSVSPNSFDKDPLKQMDASNG